MTDKYKFEMHADNVYGHAVELLREYSAKSGVHLDFGCGYGAIAEEVKELGLTYVGFDLDPDGVEDLRRRGFEAVVIDLNDVTTALPLVREVLGARALVSISVLDTLEHVLNASKVLELLHELAAPFGAPLVVSVPNVAHRDLALALITGRWQYTQTGLLDHTHTFHFTQQSLTELTRRVGWREVATNDVRLELSDQHQPIAHAALSEHTWLGKYLRSVRDGADDLGSVNQLIRTFLPGHPKSDVDPFPNLTAQSRPFLSVITRTQGRRPGSLRDVLLALSAQTLQDFEVIVLPHKVDQQAQHAIERIVDDMPSFLRERIRIERVDHGGRARPLNIGFELARGEYIAILDDDDLVFAHWVETFQSLASRAPGTMLRAVAVEQSLHATEGNASPGFAVVGPIKTTFPSKYDYFQHLLQNYSPPVCMAFPRSAFHDMNVRFNETLDTVEDWDYELRCVALCGFSESPKITAIYHRWDAGESSYTVHSQDEWKRDYAKVIDGFDAVPRVFPPGTVAYMRRQAETIRQLREALDQRAEPADPTLPIRKFGARWRRRALSFGRDVAATLKNRSRPS